jgi:anti-sigma factor RsiW
MKCEESLTLISPYLDRELDPARTLEVERHLHDCNGCAAVRKELEDLRAAIGGAGPLFSLPADLQRRVREALPRPGRPLPGFRDWHWPRLGAPAGVAAALLAVLLLLTWSNGRRINPSNHDMLLAELVAGHVRSLMVDHLVDVASPDQDTVKPWFNGKVDFAPPVAEFASDGFPLVGGRLDYAAGRPVAALVYKHRQHVVNVFLWPSARRESVTTTRSYTVQGYHLLNWSGSGLTYWAVSDLNPTDLQNLAALIQGST